MKDAITKAIEGGFLSERGVKDFEFTRSGTIDFFNMGGDKVASIYCDTVLLKTDFWQCLGKALGWPKETKEVQLDGFNLEAMANGCSPTTKDIRYNWQYHWHRFIDHLAEEKDIDEFFNNLIKNK